MNARDGIRIAGERTIGEWTETRDRLAVANNQEAWRKAYADFFMERLRTRYFNPIDILRNPDSHNSNGQKSWQGEGFAIVALQCSLIEFLGATLRGQTYISSKQLKDRKPKDRKPKDRKPKDCEYTKSGKMFVSFLRRAHPFKDIFDDKDDAKDFYVDVRCGLLHEARTRNNWRILAHTSCRPCIDVANKVIYRDNLQDAFREFADWYGEELLKSKSYQDAFIRKFDSLCVD